MSIFSEPVLGFPKSESKRSWLGRRASPARAEPSVAAKEPERDDAASFLLRSMEVVARGLDFDETVVVADWPIDQALDGARAVNNPKTDLPADSLR